MIPLSITGGQYQSKSLPISNQQLVNWYVGLVQTLGLSQEVLFGTPGLTQIAATDTAPNRGSHTKEGIPYFVNGTELWNVTESGASFVSANVSGVTSITGTDRVSMADNGSQLMIVADNKGYIYNEADENWSVNASPVGNSWKGSAFGNDIFVVVGESDAGTTDNVVTSTNGKDWTQRVSASSNLWKAVTFCSELNLFIAVSNTGTGDRVMTSTDSIIWLSQTSAADDSWTAIGVRAGTSNLCAISESDDSVMYSDNGTSWTLVAHGITGTWKAIVGNAASTGAVDFVAVGYSGLGMYTTDNGANWLACTMPSGDWEDITAIVTGASSSIYIATSSTSSVNAIAVSTDGITFNAVTLPSAFRGYAVAYGNFLAFAYGRSGQAMVSQYPYTSWVENTLSPSADNANSMVYGNYMFVAPIAHTLGDSTIYSIPYGGYGLYPLSSTQNLPPSGSPTEGPLYDNGNPQKVKFVDSYFVVTTDDKKFVQSYPNNGTLWNPLDFGAAEADPDGIQDIAIENNDSYLFGTETIEVFENIGGSGFVFQRNGLIFNKGALSKFGNINTVEGIAFLGAGKDESPTFWLLVNNQLVPISNPAIDHEIGLYSLDDIEACFAQYYSEAGEYFVSFTFPLKTFVYGMTSKRWHERSSDDAKWRVNSITKAYGILMAGDSEDGRIGQLCIDIYGEYDADVTAIASSPNFANAGDTSAWAKIEATFNSGQGNADTPNPTVTMEYADDANTFVNPRSVSIGAAGAYGVRAQWRRNGRAQRYRTVRFTYTGQSNRDFIKLEADIVG